VVGLGKFERVEVIGDGIVRGVFEVWKKGGQLSGRWHRDDGPEGNRPARL